MTIPPPTYDVMSFATGSPTSGDADAHDEPLWSLPSNGYGMVCHVYATPSVTKPRCIMQTVMVSGYLGDLLRGL